jgi:hypothetical protein
MAGLELNFPSSTRCDCASSSISWWANNAHLEVDIMVKKPKTTMTGVGAFLGALNEVNGKVEDEIYSYKHASEVPDEIQK